MNHDEREAKLPVWAQDIINRQRREIEKYKTLSEELAGGEETDVIVEPYRMGEAQVQPTYLASDSAVRFVLRRGIGPENPRYITDYIDVRLKKERFGTFAGQMKLELMGRGTLGMQMHSSNLCDVVVLQ